jgi:hypothetical protein
LVRPRAGFIDDDGPCRTNDGLRRNRRDPGRIRAYRMDQRRSSRFFPNERVLRRTIFPQISRLIEFSSVFSKTCYLPPMFGQGSLMEDGSRVGRARAALEKGCSLELYYSGFSRLVEVHAVGLDAGGREAILAYETLGTGKGHKGEWLVLALEDARKVAVSGYFSEAPRPGYRRDDPRLKQIIAQL